MWIKRLTLIGAGLLTGCAEHPDNVQYLSETLPDDIAPLTDPSGQDTPFLRSLLARGDRMEMPVDLLEYLTLSEAGVIDAALPDLAKHVTTPEPEDTPRFALVGTLLATLKAAGDARHSETTSTDLDPEEITADTVLPFGSIARLCATPPEDLGTEIARWPEDGDGFALRDSAPGEIGPRTLWLTGFNDGCARQITGALAMFAGPDLHETLRYGQASETLPSSQIDDAYEQAKSRVCRVDPGEPCGKRRDKLIQSTAFVTIYPEFGGPIYANMLLHEGEVLAFDVPGNTDQ